MKIGVKRIEKAEWVGKMSSYSHQIAFGERRDPERERIDYALLCLDEDTNTPLGYMTCMEVSSDTVYWQFGGAFPSARTTIYTFQGYQAMARWHKESKYKRVVTYIENTNLAMLKMAMKVGFLISGIRNFDGRVLLEHTLHF